MTPYTFIFIGRSGSGKGTQAKLLQEYMTAQGMTESNPMYYLETGARFREFITRESLSGKRAKEISESGKRQPDFLAVWMWSHLLVDDLKGNEHLMIDGTPRSLLEAKTLHTAFEFYNRVQPTIIYLNVSRETSEKHLLSRGRADDSRADIKERLDWFERDVVPGIEYYRTNPAYRFLQIDGERSVEEVHKDIIAGLSW